MGHSDKPSPMTMLLPKPYYILTIIISCTCMCVCGQNVTKYIFPKVRIHAFKPKGLRLWIPGNPNIQYVHMDVLVYNESRGWQCTFRKFVCEATNHRWMYENQDIELKVGYTVRYHFFIAMKRGTISEHDIVHKKYSFKGLNLDYVNHEITTLEDPNSPIDWGIQECRLTATRVLDKEVCGGDIILEEHFESLNGKLWQIENYIPINHPEQPFVSYQNLESNPTVYVKDGLLYIEPKLQQDLGGFGNESLFTEALDLQDGCTSIECTTSDFYTAIVPPIASGRLTSLIPFTYGWVHVRAKLPAGDWIYPEIVLEPFSNKYGTSKYSSGVIKIATVRGNKETNNSSYGNKALYAGPILNEKCKRVLEKKKELANGSWSDDFHVYSVKWTPDGITFYVDDVQWTSYKVGAYGLRAWLPRRCRGDWYKSLDGGGKMAPFDSYFQLAFSVAVGGHSEFPDDLVTQGGISKPWRNLEAKASLKFWNDVSSWLPTWTAPQLIIDYVKVVAL